jgi:hypothetical protein
MRSDAYFDKAIGFFQFIFHPQERTMHFDSDLVSLADMRQLAPESFDKMMESFQK